MGWQFCPRCESQLNEATLTCPSCHWDATAFRPLPDTEPAPPYLEKYRGTIYAEGSIPPHAPAIAIGRTRVLVVTALLVVVALYGSMMVLVDANAHQDRPAAVPGLTER